MKKVCQIISVFLFTMVICSGPGVVSGHSATLEYHSMVQRSSVPVDGLHGAASVTVSPDGSHLYVASFGQGTVAVFSRNSTTGSLTFVQVVRNGDTNGGLTVDGLSGAVSVTVSPDGSHLYVAGDRDDAVTVFSRNSTTGSLTFVQVIKNGDNNGGLTVDGLNCAASVTMSPDGSHLYVASPCDAAVVVFSRNSATGFLTFIQVIRDSDAGVDGLHGACSVTVSLDGSHVYVAAWDDGAIAVFSRNSATGFLTFAQVIKDNDSDLDGFDGAHSVTVSPEGSHVYVASSHDPRYVAGPEDAAVAVFSRNIATGFLTFVQVIRDGDNNGGLTVDGLGGAYSVTVSLDGSHVYVASYDDAAVAVFSRNSATGFLTFVQAIKSDDNNGGVAVGGLYGAYSVTVSPSGSHVYTAAWISNAVAVFSRNSATGTLTFSEVQYDGGYTNDGLSGSNAVAVSPDNNFVYAVGYNAAAAAADVAVFSRNSVTGFLTFVQAIRNGDTNAGVVTDGLGGAYSVTVSPDGSHVYVAGRYDHAVTVFSRNIATGSLTFVQVIRNGDTNGGLTVDGLSGAVSVTVSPDGSHLYVAGYWANAVAVFSRNSATGSLTFVQVIRNGDTNGGLTVDGLDGAYSVTVSPDSSHLYVAGDRDDAVAVFSRNSTTGSLTFVQVIRDGDTNAGLTVDGLDGAWDVTVSPDGSHLYVAGYWADAVAVFSRNSATGSLTFVQAIKDGDTNAGLTVDGLGGAESVTVSPDGSHLYVAGPNDNAVAVFSRNVSTGMLNFLDLKQNGTGGVDGLAWVSDVRVSPDGNYLFATGYVDNAVVVFRIILSSGDIDNERRKWDVNDDRKVGLEDAIHALQVVTNGN